MGIVVQKYGGSSVADADGIKRVAQRIVDTRKAGNDVVVVVSAMGDTTDELRDLAEQVTPLPPPRELDMLLTAGERISMALVAMAIAELGHKAQSFTGSQAGVITDSAHGKAKIIDITPGRIEAAIADGAIAIVAGFQGVSQDTKDITTLGRGASDTTAVALAAALGADVCEIYSDVDGVFTADPRIVPTARKLDRISTEEMLEMAASGAKILHLRCVEYARRYNMPIHVRSSFSQKEGTWVIPDSKAGDERDGAGDHRRRRPRPQRGQDHRGRRTRQGRRGGAHLRGAGGHRDQHRHGRAERLGRGDRPHRHLLHAAARRRPDRDGRAGADPGRGRLRQAALRRPDRQGLADRRRHALATRASPRSSSPRSPRPASTSR